MPASSEAASRRRQTRMRREYLYRKSLEGQEKAAYEQKRIIREALASGKPLPTEVRASYDKLKQEVDAEDITTETPKTHVDNEYGDAGLIEPQVRQTSCTGEYHESWLILSRNSFCSARSSTNFLFVL